MFERRASGASLGGTVGKKKSSGLVEDQCSGSKAPKRGIQTPESGGHDPGLQSFALNAYIGVQLQLWDKRSGGIHDQQINRGRCCKPISDAEGLFGRIGLYNHEPLDRDAGARGVIRIEGAIGVNPGDGASGALRLSRDPKRHGGFAAGRGPVQFGDCTPRQTSGESLIEGGNSRRDWRDWGPVIEPQQLAQDIALPGSGPFH